MVSLYGLGVIDFYVIWSYIIGKFLGVFVLVSERFEKGGKGEVIIFGGDMFEYLWWVIGIGFEGDDVGEEVVGAGGGVLVG